MKTKNRTIKAIVVILMVSLGVLNNIDFKINRTDSSFSITNSETEIQMKSDSSLVKTNRIITYTRSVLRSGIKHLISNL